MKNQAGFFGQTLLRLAFALCALAASPLISAQTPQVIGTWADGPNLPFFPVHVHLLQNSTVMVWPGDVASGDNPQVWNPGSGSVTAMSQLGFNPFCSGHTFLPDGRLFVAGGHADYSVGLRDASIFNPVDNTWMRQPPMNLGRWYPTVTGLPNSDVLVISGSVDVTTGTNPLPQVWQSATGTWRDLTSAQLALSMYPNMFLAPNGLVFQAGPEIFSRYLNTAGTGEWTGVGARTFNGVRDYSGAVMYEPGKILVVGGGDPPTNTAEVIDLNASSPTWRAVGSMSMARRSMNATMLPDGKILATGGTSGPGFNNEGTPVFAAELWDPATEAWSTMAAGTVPRLYHSAAVLLPDARVLVTGGNGYTQSEIFSPPYLFASARPSITSAPATAGKGQSIFVGTPDATGITGVTWMALPSVTHTNNMHQGFFRSSSIAQVAGGINTAAPDDPTVPPGFYMLFLLKNGVPSEAKIIQLGSSVAVPTPGQACSFPNWVAGGQYAAGSIVTYSDGKLYRAKFANPGYIPTVSTYFWEPYVCTTTPTPTPTPTPTLPPAPTPAPTCIFPSWVAGGQYAAGSIVTYSDGKLYRAKFANPGYIPTVSTYFWEAYVCTVTPTPSPTPTPTPIPTPPPVCSFPNWVSGRQYAAGAIVTYTDGNLYRAKFANPGYIPTVSTYFWARYTC